MSEEKQSPQLPEDVSFQPPKKNSVITYLTVLFAAAFLLLLMAYFMQQRINEKTIGNLTQSMTSIQSLEDLIQENLTLSERFETMEQKLEEANKALKSEQHRTSLAQTKVQTLEDQLSALLYLEKLEHLYETRQYESARHLDGRGEGFVEILTQLDEMYAEQYQPNQPTLIQRYQSVLKNLEKTD